MRGTRVKHVQQAVTGRWRLAERAGLLLVFGCVVVIAATVVWKNRPEKTEVKVALMGTVDASATFLDAMRKGYFADEGLDIHEDDITYVDSGRAAVKEVEAGRVDISYTTYVPMLNATHGRSDAIKVVAGASTAGPGSCVLVTIPGSKVETVADLTGATIAVTEAGTIADSLTRYALKKHGIDPRKVHWVAKSFDDMLIALDNGTIDAAFLTDPYLSMAKYRLNAVSILNTAEGPMTDIPTAGFAARDKFMSANPQTIGAFHRAISRSIKDTQRNPSQLADIVEENAKVPRPVAEAATLLTLNDRIDRRQLERVAELMRDTGGKQERVDVGRLIKKWLPTHSFDDWLGFAVMPSAGAGIVRRMYPLRLGNSTWRRRRSCCAPENSRN